MTKTDEQKAAIKKREKLAECVDPMTGPGVTAPKEGTNARRYWEYGQAYARGISRATGRPSTPPIVPGPMTALVQTMIAHARDENGKQIRGENVLEWLENVVHDFRSGADEREYGRGRMGWSPSEFARWLDNGRPKASFSRPTNAPERRAHITVKKA